jgi:hypothetical protein
MIPWFIDKDPKKVTPRPPEQIPVAALVPPTVLPTMIKKLLDRLKEASTWAGLAIVAQFLPIGMEELQVIWEAITALAAVAAMLIPEGKPAEDANNG